MNRTSWCRSGEDRSRWRRTRRRHVFLAACGAYRSSPHRSPPAEGITAAMSMHLPVRPAWSCAACGQPWPCPSRQRQLLAEYADAWVSLSLYLSGCLVQACADFGAVSAGLLCWRFFTWPGGCPATPCGGANLRPAGEGRAEITPIDCGKGCRCPRRRDRGRFPAGRRRRARRPWIRWRRVASGAGRGSTRRRWCGSVRGRAGP
jgi:hypothetical protein